MPKIISTAVVTAPILYSLGQQTGVNQIIAENAKKTVGEVVREVERRRVMMDVDRMLKKMGL